MKFGAAWQPLQLLGQLKHEWGGGFPYVQRGWPIYLPPGPANFCMSRLGNE